MTTQKQKKVAKLIIENSILDKPLNGGQMLEKVRYSKGIQEQPSRVLRSDGVKEELKVLGFDEYSAKKVVSEIMHNPENDPNSRLRATEQVFKVHGSYSPDKNLNIEVEQTQTPEILEKAKQFDEWLKKQLSR